MKKIIKWLSIPTAFVAILLIADIILPAAQKDQATITSKFISRQGEHRNRKAYNIKAEGEFKYNEQIDFELYEKVSPGDTVELGLSMFFKELKEIKLVYNEQVLDTYRGSDIYYMGIFSVIFLLPLFVLFIKRKYASDKVILYVMLSIEAIGLIILCKILLVLFGILPKV